MVFRCILSGSARGKVSEEKYNVDFFILDCKGRKFSALTFIARNVRTHCNEISFSLMDIGFNLGIAEQ